MPLKTVFIPLIVWVLLFSFVGTSVAQPSIEVDWQVDRVPPGGWTIGDPIKLELTATGPSYLDITLPELPGQSDFFEIRDQETIEPVRNGEGVVTVIRMATLIPWAVGTITISPLIVQYSDASGRIQEAPSPVLSITVNSVLTGTEGKQDLKPQASLSVDPPPIWPWILGGIVAVMVLSSLTWWVIRRRRRKNLSQEDTGSIADPRYPEDIAYEQLEYIAGLNMPAKGEFIDHYDMIADCIRVYLEGIYRIPARELTTKEILRSLKKSKQITSDEIASALKVVLDEADLVKFAKFSPTIQQALSAILRAQRLVDLTKPNRDIIITEDRVTVMPKLDMSTRR